MKHSQLARSQSRFVWLSLTPIVIYLAVFILYPLISAIYDSLRDFFWDEFIGLSNYQEAIFEDPRVPGAFLNTLLYAVIRIPPTIILGFFAALALNKIIRGRGPLIFGYFAPYITSMVAYAAVFIYLFSSTGLLNVILGALGLPAQSFTRDTNGALPSLALMDALKHIGFDVLIFMAALQNIPSSVYEAARVDGATPWQTTWNITIPLVAPTALFLVVILTIWTVQVFEPIYVMTHGGPLGRTESIVYLIWDAAFQNNRIGYASAISILLFVLLIVISLIQIQVGRTRWEY